jgi:dienelactone hydrolase
VLELARSGANLRGVVSLHGMLNSSLAARPGAIRSKILVLHGDEDPIVSMEEVMAFRKEMRLARANWEIVLYGDAKHSFTGEGVAGSPEAGLDPQSEDRSWRATIAFLDEVLKKPRTESRE